MFTSCQDLQDAGCALSVPALEGQATVKCCEGVKSTRTSELRSRRALRRLASENGSSEQFEKHQASLESCTLR